MKFTDYVVNNSITNTLSDDKFDVGSPFNFIEYLNYVKIIDNNDLENFDQYKKYLTKWKLTDFDNNKNNSINIRSIYLSFFNDLTLKYSNQEQRRFFNTIDLFEDDSLTKIMPFYRRKIVEILNYYREKRNTFQRDVRERRGKGSNLSVKDQIRNNIANFFTSPDYTGEVVSLSSLRVDIELGYDTFNDYFDVNPATVDSNETYITNDINSNASIDIDQALIDVINNNKITISELNPYKLVVEFNEINANFLQNEDFIDYKISDNPSQYRILYEAELAENLVGTDYYYLSTTDTEFISGKLFEAKNKAKNLFNINFPSVIAKEQLPSTFERDIGLYFNPTKFNILRVDGEYIKKLKPDLADNFVYVFPDPDQYGDIVNLSNTKRDNPYNFYFNLNSYKNVSSSSSRNSVKSNERSHYFHSYDSVENKRININNSGVFSNPISNLNNFGSVDKTETDIYGNEYIQFIPNKGVIRNATGRDYVQDSSFPSGNTIDITENRYGDIEGLSGYSDKINSFKQIYIKDVFTNDLTSLSSSNFQIIYQKFRNNSTIFSEITSSKIYNMNVYDTSFSMDLSSHSIVDSFLYNTEYSEQITSPLVIKKDLNNPNLAYITEDCYNNGSIYKFNISLSGDITSKFFIYELYKYDTSRKTIDQIQLVEEQFSSLGDEGGEGIGEDGEGIGVEPGSYPFNFNSTDSSVTFKKIINSELNYNSYDDSYILTTSYLRNDDSIVIHYYNYKIKNNRIVTLKNNLFTNLNQQSVDNLTSFFLARSKDEGTFNFLTGGDDLLVPSLSYPEDLPGGIYTVTFAYSGNRNINFDLTNVPQTSAGLSLYKAEVNFGDGTNSTLYSKFQTSDNTLKLDNFNHNYTSFNSSISSSGSIKFYYENGGVTTVNLVILKLNENLKDLKLKTVNGQKINSGNFVVNLIDKNNTIYNLIDTST